MGSNTSPFREDKLFFEKAALVWQVLQKPARKSIADVLQMMDPTMARSEAKKHKMKVSRLAKRIDVDKLLAFQKRKSSSAAIADNRHGNVSNFPESPINALHTAASDARNGTPGPAETELVAGKKRSRTQTAEPRMQMTPADNAIDTEAMKSGSIGLSSSKYSHGKTRWAELNRSLRETERALRADGYKVARRTKHQVAVEKSNQAIDEEKMKEWSSEYVVRFQEATNCLVEARKVDPVNASAKTICDRISTETNGRIHLSERSVRRAVQNGRAGQAPRKAGKPVGILVSKRKIPSKTPLNGVTATASTHVSKLAAASKPAQLHVAANRQQSAQMPEGHRPASNSFQRTLYPDI